MTKCERKCMDRLSDVSQHYLCTKLEVYLLYDSLFTIDFSHLQVKTRSFILDHDWGKDVGFMRKMIEDQNEYTIHLGTWVFTLAFFAN